MNFTGKTLIVTGAASGIGRGLSLEAIRRGAAVVMADRDLEGAHETERLAKEAGGDAVRCSVYQLDVSDLGQWQAFKDSVLQEYEQVDGIINNAGLTFTGKIEDMSYEHLERVMSVNFMGMVYGSKEFLPLLKKRPEAVIANVSSVFGLFPRKRQGAYCASKYAIRGFTEVLEQELKSTNVTVSSIHPGHIGTDIVNNAREEGNVVGIALSEEEQDAIANAFKKYGLPPEQAAKIILDGIQQGKRKIMVGKDAIRGDRWSRFFPARYADATNKLA